MEITFDNVYCGYKAGAAVLRGVSLHLSGPGLVCIIGPNGVGKSTLIRCMNGLLKPSSGSVAVNGKDIGEYSANDLSEFIGYVPVTSQDCFSMPVFDTVLMGRYRRNKWRTGPEDIDATERTLKLLGLSDLAMHGFNELSAGQHQKVALARGLVREPEMLILDEPTSNLDVRHQVYVTELLHEIAVQCGMMVVMISHDLNISARYADKVIVMDRPGTIKAIGEARRLHTLLARPNAMIKIPATDAGIQAFETLTAEGISVNLTLLFSRAQTLKAYAAYSRGIAKRTAAGQPVGAVRAVASFFISRVDAALDGKLPENLRGKTAIALAKTAYLD